LIFLAEIAHLGKGSGPTSAHLSSGVKHISGKLSVNFRGANDIEWKGAVNTSRQTNT
jgi:hypothetical protein